jgi:2,3-bisphosphoglycerate-dependent phosphoglycerate mutase
LTLTFRAALNLDDPVRVFALRHGQTAWNVQRRLQGQLDQPLDETGRWQAEQLARALADEELHAVYSSDLVRATATAAPLAQRLGLTVQLDPGLRERGFGRLEGLTYDQIEAQWPEDARAWRQRDLHAAPGGGETLPAFYARCLAAASVRVSQHPGQAVVLVAHGGVLDCLYRAAVGVALDAPRSWQLDNATINRLLWTPQGFTLIGWDDNQHLDAPPPRTE